MDRYENGFPVLKEIIQNSDDATADKLLMGWCQGIDNPDNPLLREPAIFFINNAPLKEEHEKGIRSIAGGSKADSKASVGKFGLGMKSLFHLCEAFFYQSNQWQEFDWAAEVFNPWGGEYRPDWHEYSKSDQIKIHEKLKQVIAQFVSESNAPWFVVWVPLRTRRQIPVGEDPIIANYEDAGSIPDFLLESSLPGKVAEILPLLKRLKQIELIIENNTGSFSSRFTIEISNKSKRSQFTGEAYLASSSQRESWSGEVKINHSGNNSSIQYAGVEKILNLEKLSQLKRKERGWPFSFQKDIKSGKVKKAPDKAEQHAAIVVIRSPADGQAYIKANWAVFLPLSETPEFQKTQIPGEFDYHIHLHGYFFVDAGRKGIHGHDDIGADAQFGWSEGDEKALRKAWNQTLANEGTLDAVLPAIDNFISELRVKLSDVEIIGGGLKQVLPGNLLRRVTANHQWLYQVSKDQKGWSLTNTNKKVRLLPRPDSDDYSRVWEALPALGDLEHTIFAERERCNIYPAASNEWTISELRAVLDVNAKTAFSSNTLLSYLNRFIGSVFFQRDHLQEQLKQIAKTALTDIALSKLSGHQTAVQKFVSTIYKSSRVSLAIDKSDVDIWSEIIKLKLGVLLVPSFLDPADERSEAALSIDDSVIILKFFDHYLRDNLRDHRRVAVAEKLIGQVLQKSSKADRNSIYKQCSNLKLFKVKELSSNKDRLLSQDDLVFYLDNKRLFQRSGKDNFGLGLAKELVKATAGIEVFFVAREVVNLALSHMKVPECNDDAVLETLGTYVSLSAVENRIDLLNRLVSNRLESDTARKGLRYLLHGSQEDNSTQTLWKNENKTREVWTEIWRLGSKEVIPEWCVLPDALGQVLNDRVKTELKVKDVSPKNVIADIGEDILSIPFDELNLSDTDIDEVLAKVSDKSIWRQLPLHLTTNGQRVSINDRCILQSEKPLPAGFDVTLIKRSPFPEIEAKQQSLIGKPEPAHLIRLALTQDKPEEHAEFILTQMKELKRLGNRLGGDIQDKLKSVAWLTTHEGQAVSPNQVIQLNPQEYSAAYTLAQNPQTQCVPLNQITLVEKGSTGKEVLELITKRADSATRLLLSEAAKIPEYALGELKEVTAKDVDQVAQSEKVLNQLPGWELLYELHTNSKGRIDLSEATVLCNAISHEVMISTLNNLAEVGNASKVEDIRKSFLRALCRNKDAGLTLTKVTLRTKANRFRYPEELAMNYSGISRDYLIHPDEWKVVQHALIKEYGTPYATFDYDETFVRNKSSAILKKYFEPWEGHVPTDAIAGFLSLFSGQNDIEKYAASLLHSRTLDGVLQSIADNPSEGTNGLDLKDLVKNTTLIPEIHNDKDSTVISLLSKEITVPLDSEPRSILIIQKIPNAAGRQKRWRVSLRRLNPDEMDRSRLVQILRESTELIIDRIYGRTTELSSVWEALGQTSQMDVKVAQSMIMEHIILTLERLKVQRGHPKIEKLIQEYRYLQTAKAEAEANGVDDWDHRDIDRIKKDIREVIEKDPSLRNFILEQMRHEIKNNSQYFASSIPFELFQNADDAVGEKLDMYGKDVLSPALKRFIVRHEAECHALSFYHWGREVNSCLSSYEYGQGRFNRDLQKMVTLNISDKDGESTGKFGLGFKSCLIVSDKPEIHSGELAVTIEAGILPVISENARKLDECVAEHELENKRPSLVRLALNHEYQEPDETQKIVANFEQAAGVLCVFSKHIKTIEVRSEQKPVQWAGTPCSKISGLYFGRAKLPNNDGKLVAQRVVHYRTKYGQFLFQIDSDGLKSMVDRTELPKVWVLNPLMEELPAGFVIESKKFQVDIGRSQLAKDNDSNLRCMSQLAIDLVELLRQIHQWIEHDWDGFKNEWSLRESFTPEQFWASVWRVLTDGWPQMLTNHDSKAVLFKELFVAQGGLLDFYKNTPVVPNRLGNKGINLISLENVDCYTDRLLNQLYFDVRQLPSLAERVNRQSLLSYELGLFMDKLSPGLHSQLTLVGLINENIADNRVDPESAEALGQLFNDDLSKKYNEANPGHTETSALEELLSQLNFKSQRGGWGTPDSLTSSAATGEEALIAAFAPTYGLLCDSYKSYGQSFFDWCRKSFKPDLLAWARLVKGDGNSRVMQEALLKYLISGRNGQNLAENIKENWHDQDLSWIQKIDAAVLDQWGWNNTDIDEYCRLMTESESELNKRVSKWKEQSSSQVDPDEVLLQIFKWWEENKETELPEYENKLYAKPLPWKRMREDDDLESIEARKGWIQLFYLGSCQTIGRVQEGHHRKAIEWMDNRGWWDILASPEGVPSEKWTQIMDEYLETAESQEQYRIWMQVLPLYRFVTNLEDYVDLFMKADLLTCLDDLQVPGESQALQGSGIHVPELKATLGIGINFIIRELIRHDVIEAEASQQYGFVLPHQIRKLFLKLDGCDINDEANPAHSEEIYWYIAKYLREEHATFDDCFDIPFRVLAAYPSLCRKILGIGIWDEE